MLFHIAGQTEPIYEEGPILIYFALWTDHCLFPLSCPPGFTAPDISIGDMEWSGLFINEVH
jgi:hypothetical protein